MNEISLTTILDKEDIKLFNQAKELEKQQIENAWKDGNYRYSGYGDSETYYEETYENEKGL